MERVSHFWQQPSNDLGGNIAVIYDGNTLRLFGNTYSIDVFLYAHKVSRYIFQRYLCYNKRLIGFF